MKYLGIKLEKPKVAFFGFTGCEGCQLQIANKEETLADLLGSVDVRTFRLISSDKDGGYDVAFVEGSITTESDAERLRVIRDQAKILVAMGACACLGGVHKLRERFNLEDAVAEVYGDFSIETGPVRRLSDVVKVDIELPGCPISKPEFEWLVRHLILGLEPKFPEYPVCVECKRNANECVFDKGLSCLGPIAYGGCDAVCVNNGHVCDACRGLLPYAIVEAHNELMLSKGISKEAIKSRYRLFCSAEKIGKDTITNEH